MRYKSAEGFSPCRSTNSPARAIEKIIAGRSCDRPRLPGRDSSGLQNLLDDNPCPGPMFSETLQKLFRVAQTVGMVHAQAIQPAALQPLAGQGKGLTKNAVHPPCDRPGSVVMLKKRL